MESLIESLAGLFFALMILVLVFLVLIIVSFWKIFTKAGKPGWAAIVPIYNSYVIVQVARLPIYYFILVLIPTLLNIAGVEVPSPGDSIIGLVSFVVWSSISYNLAKQFGKSIGYAVGLIFLPFIFFPMLAFGDAVYQQEEMMSNSTLPSNPVAVATSEQVATSVNEQETSVEETQTQEPR